MWTLNSELCWYLSKAWDLKLSTILPLDGFPGELNWKISRSMIHQRPIWHMGSRRYILFMKTKVRGRGRVDEVNYWWIIIICIRYILMAEEGKLIVDWVPGRAITCT